MPKSTCRPPNQNPLAPCEKVHQSELDPTVVTLLATALATAILVIELIVFTIDALREAEHLTLDKVIAWTFIAWLVLVVTTCVRVFSGNETAYPGP